MSIHTISTLRSFRTQSIMTLLFVLALLFSAFPQHAQAQIIVDPTCGLSVGNFAAPAIGANLLANANPNFVKSGNKAVCVSVTPGGKTFQARLKYTARGVVTYTAWTNVKGSVGSAILKSSKPIPAGTLMTLQVKHTNVGWILLIVGTIRY